MQPLCTRDLRSVLAQPKRLRRFLDFFRRLAKQHRMAVMTAACLLGIGEWFWDGGQRILEWAAWLIALGAIVTCGTRIRAISRSLRARP